jgi:hypothetical protein
MPQTPPTGTREESIVGHWDHQGIELFSQETADTVFQTLPVGHGFHMNGVIRFRGTHWLHVGWDDANAIAYRALVTFCQQTRRRWITSYANDRRAELDATFFGAEPSQREAQLSAVFGPPEAERALDEEHT